LATHTLHIRPDPGSGQTLTPGATTNDEAEASGNGEDAIARWDFVPHQTYTAAIKVGVVAFHESGIQKVSFQANGGTVVEVSTPSLNSTSGVVEHWVSLAPAASDGVVEVQAIAYPVNGITRVLTIELYSNGEDTASELVRYVATDGNDDTGDGTSLTPFATILKAARDIQDEQTGNADGGTIYLKAGSYTWGEYSFALFTTTVDRWLTIMPAPGLDKTDVTITGSSSSDGIRTKLVRMYDCTITGRLLTPDAQGHKYWFDNCGFTGANRTANLIPSGFDEGYWTDCTMTILRNGPSGQLVRDITLSEVGEIAFQQCGLLVNSSVEDIAIPEGEDYHPDVYQFFGNTGNVIIYGLTADTDIDAQGLFAGNNIDLTDCAIVDVTVVNGGVWRTFSFGGPTRNLYVKDSSFTGPLCTWVVAPEQNFIGTAVVVENSTFDEALESASGVTVR
jgi:hypothetical protein